MVAILEVHQVVAGVLDRCSLTVPAGSLSAVVGLVGSGRSTLAKVVMGAQVPERGRVVLDGVDVTEVSPVARARFGMGWVRQTPRPFASLSVEENVLVAASATRRWGGQEAARRTADMLERYGLASLARLPAWRLDRRQATRLEVVRALAAPRRLIVVDELSSCLPADEVAELAQPICATAQMGGAVVWLDAPGSLPVIPDRVAVLGAGRVLVDGPPQDVETSPEWASMLGRDAAAPIGAWSAGGGPAEPGDRDAATATGWPQDGTVGRS